MIDLPKLLIQLICSKLLFHSVTKQDCFYEWLNELTHPNRSKTLINSETKRCSVLLEA